MNGLEIGAIILTIIGAVLNAHRNRRCFHVWLAADAFMVYDGIATRQPAIPVIFTIYAVLCIYGFWKWEKA